MRLNSIQYTDPAERGRDPAHLGVHALVDRGEDVERAGAAAAGGGGGAAAPAPAAAAPAAASRPPPSAASSPASRANQPPPPKQTESTPQPTKQPQPRGPAPTHA